MLFNCHAVLMPPKKKKKTLHEELLALVELAVNNSSFIPVLGLEKVPHTHTHKLHFFLTLSMLKTPHCSC